jgi:hypothetical protein
MCAIQTIYGQLENILEVDLTPAPDQWDRLYNVDFFIEVNKKHLGIQIRSFTSEPAFEKSKATEFLETSCKFMKKFGGVIFIVFYVLVGKKKVIYNLEVIAELKKEIERLKRT